MIQRLAHLQVWATPSVGSPAENLSPKFLDKYAYKVKFDKVSDESGNTTTLQLLRTFFQYYNEYHDFENDAISITGGLVVRYVPNFLTQCIFYFAFLYLIEETNI